MSDELKKTLPRIRTFADDFEHDRKESGLPLPPGVSAPQAVEPTPMAASPQIVILTDTAKSEGDATVNTPVPAFHELKKRSSSDNIAAPAKAATIQTRPIRQVAPIEDSGAKTVVVRRTKTATSPKPVSSAGATIITDNKRNKQGLVPALIEAVRSWFKKMSADAKQKPTPKYTVVDTERRKGVIQKATTKTGTIFTADNETLKEEIRRRNWKKQATDSDEPDITWSPNIEVGYPLLDSGLPKPSNVNVEFKRRVEPTPVVPPAPTVIVPPHVFVEPTIPEPVVVPEPAIVAPPPEAPTEPEPIVSYVEELEPEPEPEYALTTPEAHYRIRSIGDVTKLNTNLLSIGVVGIVAGIIIVILVGRLLVGFILADDPLGDVLPATPIALGTSVTDLTLDAPTQEALLIALQQIPDDVRAQHEFRIVDRKGLPLQKSVLLPLLGFTNSGSLSQTIVDLHILYTQDTRGIVFTVTDATTAFGSLLAWEVYMVDSLGPILNIIPTTETIVVSDRTIANTDVRIFTAGDQEMLVYGFIGANKVLITKDLPSFTATLGSQ